MKVALAAVAGTVGGPATYAVELVRALVDAAAADRFVVLTDRPEAFDSFAETRLLRLPSTWQQPWWDHVRVPRALRAETFDLYHATKGVLAGGLPVPAVVTVHDLASYVMPATFGFAQRVHLAWETPRAIARARAVVVPSTSTAADAARLFPRYAHKLKTIPEAAATGLRPATAPDVAAWRERYKRHGLHRPACGYLGTLQPRKNLDLLVSAFLRAAGDRDWRLVVAGRLRPGYRPSFLRGDDRRVVYLGPLSASEVPAFFGAVRCMVSPSAYEGFGLSCLEAMACGCPVVALRNSSLPEVVGDAGVLVEANGDAALAEAIERLMTDDRAVADLSRRGRERAARFSWRQTAVRTLEVYRDVLEASGRGGPTAAVRGESG